MFGGNQESDKALLKSVSRRLERTGTQSRLTATVQGGTVTIRGKLRFENQRRAIVKSISGVSGVRNVVDQLVAPPKMRPDPLRHSRTTTAPVATGATPSAERPEAPEEADELPPDAEI
jgi:hypothetical protein